MSKFKVPVFFSSRMIAKNEGAYSPSARKPGAAVRSWERKFPIDVKPPRALTEFELAAAHDLGYVRNVLRCKQTNGFGNTSPEVAKSLPFTSGAMYDAALEALRNGKVACAPVSGFHHAGFSSGGGFCTFNGLMVTAKLLLNRSKVQKVGIIDFDMHYGNGTDDIIKRMKLKGKVFHYTFGEHTRGREEAGKSRARVIVDHVKTIIEWMAAHDVDIILYQAGADPHVNDPLGGLLTNEEMEARDRLVFETAREYLIPVAWDLAGGYQKVKETVAGSDEEIRPVLDIHDATMKVCCEVYGG